MTNTKNILKNSFRLLLIVVLSAFATSVASAKTISDNMTTASDSMFTYFNNLYERSGYKNYLMSIEYIPASSGYYSYTNYYVCLTNEDVVINDSVNASANCEELYKYNYRSYSDYTYEKLTDNSLTVTNGVYYTNDINDNNYVINKLLILLNIGVLTFFLSFVILKIFRS